MTSRIRFFFLVCTILAHSLPAKSPPVIYSTDLFHPSDDPDDHYDLATVFALTDLDLRAVILDLGQQQRKEPGEIPLKQMMHLTGRTVAFTTGLQNPLKHPEDTGADQFWHGGPDLILKVLEAAETPAYIITTGSVRDVVAAFNRKPVLFRAKVSRIYVNAGNAVGGELYWNPRLDPQAYVRLMTADLPVYWAPCFGGMETLKELAEKGLEIHEHQTYWRFRQGDLFDGVSAPLRAFFLYGLYGEMPKMEDPIKALAKSPTQDKKQWDAMRNMWSTVTLYHAAGRKLYRRNDEWAVLETPKDGYRESEVYDFVPASTSIDRDLRTKVDTRKTSPGFHIFRIRDAANYQKAMLTSLRTLLAGMHFSAEVSK